LARVQPEPGLVVQPVCRSRCALACEQISVDKLNSLF